MQEVNEAGCGALVPEQGEEGVPRKGQSGAGSQSLSDMKTLTTHKGGLAQVKRGIGARKCSTQDGSLDGGGGVQAK